MTKALDDLAFVLDLDSKQKVLAATNLCFQCPASSFQNLEPHILIIHKTEINTFSLLHHRSDQWEHKIHTEEKLQSCSPVISSISPS